MTELEGCIRFWESILKTQRWSMELSTIAIIEATIKLLKKLKEEESK